MLLDMLGFCLFRNQPERETVIGIHVLKKKEYKGGKKKINVEEIKKLKSEGLGATAIAKRMNIHRDSVYRLLKK